MNAMEFERQIKRSHHVDLTPLTDVMFILIIFFMITTSFVLSESLELKLPSDTASDQVSAANMLAVTVNQAGQVEVSGNLYSRDDFKEIVRRIIQRNPHQAISLVAQAGASVQQLISVLDIMYLQGAKNVQIDQMLAGASSAIGGDVTIGDTHNDVGELPKAGGR